MSFDFRRYLDAFNVSDDEEAFARDFYTEDLIVEGPQGPLRGRPKWVETLQFFHVGIKEKLRPRTIVREGDVVMAEVIGEFTAVADRPDFPYGPLKKGESIKVRMFARYQVRGDKIAGIVIASWPPGLGVD